MLTIKTKTSELRLYIEGSKNDEVILLLSGGPGVPDYLQDVSSLLNKKYKTVRFDQRGVGASLAYDENYDIEHYLSDIDSIIKELDVDSIHIFGHSWGGLLAQIYAAKNPAKFKSLFLCSPSSGVGTIWKEMEKEVMNYNKNQATSMEWFGMGFNSLLGMMGVDFGYKKVFANVWRYYFKDPKDAPPANKDWLDGINAASVNSTRKNIIKMSNEKLNEKMKNIKLPIILTYGKYDIYGESKTYSFERLVNAKVFEFENAGHLPWIQDKDAFIKVINNFYNGKGESRLTNRST